MPRIRKKTSNRQTTRDRAKIKTKVSDHHKKAKKAAKKDVTWKSNKKADPGIPNTYPYKDKVLAELAEEKRQAEEAKLARREANRNPNQHEPEDETPGIQSLHKSSVLTASIALPVSKATAALIADVEDEEDEDIPNLIDSELTNLQDVIDKADVLIEVVDARDIAGGRCGWVEALVKDAGGKVILVVTKIDLVPREALEQWLPHLSLPTFLFSASPIAQTPVRGRAEILSALRSLTSTSSDSAEPVIALMGLPNSGKTTLLNALLPATAKRHEVAPASGGNNNAAKHPEPTTKIPVEVTVDVGEGKKVSMIDTPGWELVDEEPEDEDEEEEVEGEISGQMDKWDLLEERVAGDLLRRNLGRVDKVKDILPLASYIVSRSNGQDLMLAYNTPFFAEGDVEAFLTDVARVNGRVKKHGVVDLDSAARIIVRDWAQGNFPYYSTPPKTPASTSSAQADMSAVLATCRGRKEMRATGGKGLIRFRGGEIDERPIVMDDDYTAMLGLSDDEEEEGDEEDDDLELGSDEGEELDLEDGPEPASGSSVADDDEDEDDEDVEEEPVEMVSRKNKRKAEEQRPKSENKRAKRVSFGRDVVGFGKVESPAATRPAVKAAPVPGRATGRSKGKGVSKGAASKAGKKPKMSGKSGKRSRRG